MNTTLEAKDQEIAELRERIQKLEIDNAELQAELDFMYAKIEEFNAQQEPTAGRLWTFKRRNTHE